MPELGTGRIAPRLRLWDVSKAPREITPDREGHEAVSIQLLHSAGLLVAEDRTAGRLSPTCGLRCDLFQQPGGMGRGESLSRLYD